MARPKTTEVPVPWVWWGAEESLILTVATWAVEVGALDTALKLLAYFTEPQGFLELYNGWSDSPNN